jgi:hypothetical protein
MFTHLPPVVSNCHQDTNNKICSVFLFGTFQGDIKVKLKKRILPRLIVSQNATQTVYRSFQMTAT